ncbi:hypothetical protein [Kineococcus rhizosphaerae]|uniref:Uncharacterized protein n=1 Tax=Kineococcus rhizosphaerae TaxID=559628 RepID=A0A2T0R8C3_9ACTN|nr:hypothetical protein [Kineococcus rhizosphaerae]PRY17421.1 hypothetical protein CLV37_102384 [Kineococcus rhizosphaerae]
MPVPPRPPLTTLSVAAVLAAALPVVLLLGDLVVSTLPTDDDAVFTATGGDWAVAVEDVTEPGPVEQLLQTLATTSVAPALLASCLGLAVLGALSVAGHRLRPGVRAGGVVVAGAVVAVALAAAAAAVVEVPYDGGLVPDPGGALRDAPVVGPLVALAVLSALAAAALGRRAPGA